MEAESQILSHALWPLLVFTLAALWLAGLSSIWSNRGSGSFTAKKLAAMAVVLSFAAVGSFLAVEAVLSDGWRNLSPDGSGVYCEEPAESYVFSFVARTRLVPAAFERRTRYHRYFLRNSTPTT